MPYRDRRAKTAWDLAHRSARWEAYLEKKALSEAARRYRALFDKPEIVQRAEATLPFAPEPTDYLLRRLRRRSPPQTGSE